MSSDLGEVLWKYYRRKVIAKRDSTIWKIKCNIRSQQMQVIRDKIKKKETENKLLIRIYKDTTGVNNLLKNVDDLLNNEIENLKKNIDELKNQIKNKKPIRKGKTRDIWDASDKGCLAAVKFYWAENPANIKKKNENYYHWTPLHYAARKGRLNIARFLYSKGAEIDAVTTNYSTPLMIASSQCQFEVVNFLLDSGANIDFQNINRRTCLHFAVLNYNFNIVELLYRRGANRTIIDVANRTPLDYSKWVSHSYHNNEFRNRLNKAPLKFVEFLEPSIVNYLESNQHL